jgi:hypothetical protein
MNEDDVDDVWNIMDEASWEQARRLEPHGPVVPGNVDTYGTSLRYCAVYFPALADKVAGLDAGELEQLNKLLQDNHETLPQTGFSTRLDEVIAEYNAVYNSLPADSKWEANEYTFGAAAERYEQLTGTPIPQNPIPNKSQRKSQLTSAAMRA